MPNEDKENGVDWSRWNGEVDAETAKAQGIWFAAGRVTVGDYYTDPLWLVNRNHFVRAGIYTTGYHVVRPDKDAKVQADKFLVALTTPLPWMTTERWESDWPTIMDNEVKKKNRWALRNFPTRQIIAVTQEVAFWIEKWEGRKPIMYSNFDYITNFLKSAPFLKEYYLFEARYSNNPLKYLPPLNPPPMEAVLQQWSADKNRRAPEFGFYEANDIDLDVCLKGRPWFEQNLLKQDTPKPPPVDERLQDMHERIMELEAEARVRGWDV